MQQPVVGIFSNENNRSSCLSSGATQAELEVLKQYRIDMEDSTAIVNKDNN